MKTYFVCVDIVTNKFLATDDYSGGYPYWTDDVRSARFFEMDERSISYIKASANEHDVEIRQIVLGHGNSVEHFENASKNNIREQALSKLSEVERRALGV